ncbi:MAG: Integral membrane protein YggT, involved in response to extracytoplasmic stress (osmotic shock) [Firmicutes bacterium]|nr:Integral membrane protein YggT, involved in response to extracytoplasmic stress (osmotic shock) [Bacillota bacterium]MDI6705456.1 YggT family protein [Bacillota bacterium]
MVRLNWVLNMSLRYFFNTIELLVLARIILSWVSPGYNNPISRFIYNITEPILAPFRRLLERSPFGGGMIDFSPILAILFIRIVVQPLMFYLVRIITAF